MPEISFQLHSSSEDLDYNVQSKLAFVTDTRPSQIRPELVAAILDPDTVNSALGEHALRQFAEQLHTLPERERIEQMQSFWQCGEALLHRDVLTSSYGVHMPSYLAALEEYRRLGTVEPRTSLLVGALTPETVVEYAVTTKHVFPDSALQVLDVVGVRTREACRATGIAFNEGTVLKMPYPPYSLDLMQAHYLLDQLEDAGLTEGSYHGQKNRFLQEAHTTLKSDGLLLLVEPIIPRQAVDEGIIYGEDGLPDLNKVAQLATIHQTTLERDLQAAGFTSIDIVGAPGFRSRRDLEHLLLTNDWTITADMLDTNPASMLIAAVA